ncbi:MAG: ParB N-terminal domain-containing protein [Woeseiaceae bacterium]
MSQLKPAPYNPRKISKQARAGLASSMKRFGVVQQPVWNRRTGHVVGGNQRLELLAETGVKEIEVVVVDLPLIEEKALNVALNDRHLQGDFTDDIQSLVAEIREGIDDLPDELNFDKLVANITEAAGGEDEIAETYAVMVECKNERQQQKLFKRLEGEGFSCRLLTS